MTYDPLRLIQFCLEEGIPIQIVDFAATVKGVSFPQKIVLGAPTELQAPERAVLSVEAPLAVGKDLSDPAKESDVYILIHIPRQALVRMESPIVLPGRRPA